MPTKPGRSSLTYLQVMVLHSSWYETDLILSAQQSTNNMIVLLWTVQVQLLPQIIANRVALIMVNKRKASYLKIGLVLCITPICAAVCYIWTSSHLPGATALQVRTNLIFEKCEKSFFLIIDLALNLYFLYLVRFNLIAAGLNKYWRLFNWNVGMVIISTALDALLLGFLSLSNQFM